MTAFQNKNADVYKNRHRVATRSSTKQLASVVEKWAKIDGHELIQVNDKVYAWPSILFNEFDLLLQHLRVIYSGVLLGEMAHKKFIPDHALAMSLMVSEEVKKMNYLFQTQLLIYRKTHYPQVFQGKAGSWLPMNISL
ncbi:RsmF rRNA methyltransferase first C-terminal domain-containing protein [Niabella ginsengisoli]|uniref:RsmF rRNA methyltransferase first C-terminal domain-containing protein n=1 Tax=Niabella ginsengisoli TaxID=522298 RepID=A0ABS9SG25_9BACT|nr:RsmF rRNA methyltransferase first C-terminal domain-containing protein [Niabella ginsengisoli]MCH5597280.1 RsmF rRNA methyltransferase first C-terminal domain-containing protein [Niabella ginsengisoli]